MIGILCALGVIALFLFMAWWINIAPTGGKYWWRWW